MKYHIEPLYGFGFWKEALVPNAFPRFFPTELLRHAAGGRAVGCVFSVSTLSSTIQLPP
jgi:hypothetical protein